MAEGDLVDADQSDATQTRFVIQRHRARTLHYDCRLEKDGVFKSWAVPKDLPDQVGVKHLTIAVEDQLQFTYLLQSKTTPKALQRLLGVSRDEAR